MIYSPEIRRAWDNFYNEDEIFVNRKYKNEEQPIKTDTTVENIFVYNTAFRNCNSQTSGGTIYYNCEYGNLLVEFSEFIECSTNVHGGSIYAEGCNCVINCICSFKSYAKNYGQFIYSKAKDELLNNIFNSSICSSNDVKGLHTPIEFHYGMQNCKLVNISNNFLEEYSAIYYIDSKTISNITLCVIVSNYAESIGCIALRSSESSYKISECNIINNSQGTKDNAIIIGSKNLTIQNCCIMQEENCPLLYAEPNAVITIINTYIQIDEVITVSPGRLEYEGESATYFTNDIEIVKCINLIKKAAISLKVIPCIPSKSIAFISISTFIVFK